MVRRLLQRNRRKIADVQYARIYARKTSGNEVRLIETPPEPRKGVYQVALGCHGEETSSFNLFVVVCIIV